MQMACWFTSRSVPHVNFKQQMCRRPEYGLPKVCAERGNFSGDRKVVGRNMALDMPAYAGGDSETDQPQILLPTNVFELDGRSPCTFAG